MAGNDRALILSSTSKERVDVNPSVSIRNLTAFTWEAWIKVGTKATNGDQRAWMERQGGSQKRLRFAVTPIKGALRFEFARADGQADTNYTYPITWDDRWYHCAFNADLGAEHYQIILNGGVVQEGKLIGCGKDNQDQPLPVSDTAAQAVYIGASSLDGSTFSYWDGKIDCIRLWKSVQSDSAIQGRLFDFTPATSNNLLGEWQLEDTGSSVISAVKGTENTTGTWTATLKRNGVAVTNLWTTDRPFLGGGEDDTTAPSTPTMSAPSALTATSVNLAWTAATDNVYVQNYEVTVSETNDFTTPIDGWSARNVGLALSTSVTSLAPNTNYYVRVRALDANGNGSDYATYNNNAAITTLAVGDLIAPTPPTVSLTATTATTFTLAWTGATDNVAVTGYKLDIATDPDFAQCLPDYRNADLGNVTTLLVNLGVQPLTVYYVRVRAYDAAQNESVDSATLVVTTPSLPDLEPPAPVLMQPATSIEARRFTARWNVGVDNVAVTGYLLDVGLDENFTAYLPGYQGRDVGDVVEYNVSPCEPLTSYYTRVRAYDAAGNVSANSDFVEVTATLPLTVSESGILDVGVEPLDATYVSSTTPSTPKDSRERFLPVRDQIGPYEQFVRTTTGVVGYWPLNDPPALLVHNLLGTVDGDVEGTPTMRVAGPLAVADASYGLTFDGVDDYITFTDLALAGDTAVEFIIYPRTTAPATIFATGNAVGIDELSVALDATGKIIFKTATNTTFTTLTSNTAVTLNAWNHVLVQVAGTTGTIYLNGAQVATGAMSALRAVARPSSYLGCALNKTALLANADVTELAIYSRALSATEAAARRTAMTNATPILANQRAVLRFDYDDLVGGVASASLRFFAYNGSAAPITVTALMNDVWTTATLTEGTLPAQAAGSVAVTAPTAGAATEVDVTSLLDPAKRTCSLLLDLTGGDGVLIGSQDDPLGNRPVLLIELDVADAVEAKTLTLTAENITVTNLVPNPSFEGGLTGAVATTGATVTATASAPFHGEAAIAVATTGSAPNQGAHIDTAAGLARSGVHTFRGSVWVRAASDDYTLGRCFLRVTHTDNSTVDSAIISVQAGSDWSNLVLPAVTSSVGKTVDRLSLYVTHNAATARSFDLDAALIYDVGDLGAATVVPYFDGSSPNAFWLGAANASASVQNGVELVGEATYVGDANADATATVQFRRSGGDLTWTTHPDTALTIDRLTKSVAFRIPAFLATWNYLRNQSFETGTAYVTATNAAVESVTDARAVAGDQALLVTPSAASTIALATAPNLNLTGPQTLTALFTAWTDVPQTVTATVTVRTSAGTQTATLPCALLDYAQQFALPTVTVAAGVTVHQVTLSLATTGASEPYLVDAAQVQTVDGPFLAAGASDVWWIGNDEASPSKRLLANDRAYDVLVTFTDPDGVLDTGMIGETVTTPLPPDNVMTVQGMTLTPQTDRVDVAVTYTGDDDETVSAIIEWKRSDLTTWSLAPVIWNRGARQITSLITNLVQGTDYDVRVTLSDDLYPIYGENPLLRTVRTAVAGLAASATPRILFGGFSLLDPQNPNIGVTSHDAFSHPDRATQIEKLPRLDGAVQVSDYWAARKIKMSGLVRGATRDELATNLAALKRALAKGSQRLVIDTLDNRGYYFIATCTSFSTSEKAGETFLHILWDAEFTCADPFRYAATETVEPATTMLDGNAITITNDGDVQADPIFTVTTTNAVTPLKVTLTNKTTGARITPEVTILVTDKLEIDVGRLNVTKNGVAVDFSGSFPRLAVGANQITVTLAPPTSSGGNTSKIALSVRRRHRYF